MKLMQPSHPPSNRVKHCYFSQGCCYNHENIDVLVFLFIAGTGCPGSGIRYNDAVVRVRFGAMMNDEIEMSSG